MFFDQSDYVSVVGMFAFPDFPFGDLPVQPSQIMQQDYIQANPSGRQIDINASTGSE